MQGQPPVTVSVIIPCRNEKDHIEDCLCSVLAQEPVPGGFEVIVADGMSEDGTREILLRRAQADQRLTIIDNPQRIAACAMNAGIQKARGRFIARLDAHNYYAPDYLAACLDVLEITRSDNVGGSMVCQGESWLQKAIAIAHHTPFAVGGARWHDAYYEGPADTVFGGFYRREVFERVGLFDETLVRNQDDEFNLRLTRAGGKIWHSPRIKSWYRPRSGLKALFRQYLQYGYWKVRVIQKHRAPASVRHLVPGGFVLCLVGLLLLGLFFPLALELWVALIVAYASGNLVAATLTAARQGWAYLPCLPVVFACYHFGYGIGFLRGIIDFVILRRQPSARFTELTRSSASSFQKT
ncbi:MAG: glycosyltransferase family 2 protein [Candidatus Binatia bacterium]